MALNSKDEVVQRAAQVLTQQRENMDKARSTVVSLQDEIRNGMRGAAADAFVNRMQDWLDRQKIVRDKFEEIYDNFTGAHREISSAHDQATSVGSNGFGGSVYSGLSPRP
jgi:hypothetical protein